MAVAAPPAAHHCFWQKHCSSWCPERAGRPQQLWPVAQPWYKNRGWGQGQHTRGCSLLITISQGSASLLHMELQVPGRMFHSNCNSNSFHSNAAETKEEIKDQSMQNESHRSCALQPCSGFLFLVWTCALPGPCPAAWNTPEEPQQGLSCSSNTLPQAPAWWLLWDSYHRVSTN